MWCKTWMTFLILFTLGKLHSQVVPDDYEISETTRDFYNTSGNVVYTFNLSKGETRGSPMMFEEWKSGELYFSTKTRKGNLRLNYNAYTDDIYYNNSDNKREYIVLDKQYIDYMVLETGDPGKLMIMRKTLLPKTMEYVFMEVLYSGKLNLFLRISKSYFEANTGQGYATRTYNEYVKDYEYYFSGTDYIAYKLKTRKRPFLKIFGEDQDRIGNYMEENDIDLKKQEDLIRVFRYYDTVIADERSE